MKESEANLRPVFLYPCSIRVHPWLAVAFHYQLPKRPRPLGDHAQGVGVYSVRSEGRHLSRAAPRQALIQDGPPRRAGRNQPAVLDAELVVKRGHVDEAHL